MAGLLAKERIIAPPDYNRWRVPLASIAIHLCIGSVYAWSIYNPSLTRVHGVVTSAADDWSLSAVVWVFTVAIVFLGLADLFATGMASYQGIIDWQTVTRSGLAVPPMIVGRLKTTTR